MIHGIFLKHPPSAGYREAINKLASRLTLDPKRNTMNTLWLPECWFAFEKAACLAHASDALVVLAWGRIDNREELGQKLSLSSSTIQTLTTPEWIQQAWLHYQEACTEHLIGDYSFVVYDARMKRLFLARDHLGVRPLYYYDDASIFAFSTSMPLFHLLPHVSIKPRLEWASQFLISHSLAMDFEKTAYHQVFKCPPAHHITVTGKQVQKKRYFTFHTDKIHFNHSDDYLDYYRSHLEQAVKQRVQVDHPLGAELSGGIDSSTVVAFALQYYSRPISDFHAFAFAYFENEPKQILSISQHYRIPMTHVCCNISEFPHDSNRVLNILGAPNQHGNTVSHEIFYARAETLGVQTLLSGFGGDEFVTSIHGYLYLHELIKQKQYKQLYQNMQGNTFTQPLRFMKFVLHHGQGGVKNKRMANAFAERWPDIIVKPSIIENYALKTTFENMGKFDQGYQDLDQFTLEKRLQPFISTRTEECSLMAHHYGLEYRWPLLDVRLIQCFLSIPSREKYYKGQGRYLHRRAIAHKVPANIIAQNSKYMGKRMAQSIPKRFALNDDLHPALFDLVDIEKIRSQEKKWVEQVALNSPNMHQSSMMSLRQNIHRLNAIDDWLKCFYPNHCEWEI